MHRIIRINRTRACCTRIRLRKWLRADIRMLRITSWPFLEKILCILCIDVN